MANEECAAIKLSLASGLPNFVLVFHRFSNSSKGAETFLDGLSIVQFGDTANFKKLVCTDGKDVDKIELRLPTCIINPLADLL